VERVPAATPQREPLPSEPSEAPDSPVVDLAGGLETRVADAALADELMSLPTPSSTGGDAEFLTQFARRVREGDLTLPPMPESVLRIGQLLSDPDVTLRTLARQVERDPAVATRLVGVANSPFYAGLESVRSVSDALTRLGMREAWRALLSIALRSKVFRAAGARAQAQQLWEHALATAAACQALAAERAIDPDPAFLAGLVHDIGRVAILATADDMLRRSRGQQRASTAALERVLAVAHARLGGRLAESWHLDPDICRAVEAHHRSNAELPLARVLGAADALARRTTGQAEVEGDVARIESLGLEPVQLELAVSEAAETYALLAKQL
jgi:putative nucleotidyltransferase with HDIG domain